MIGRPNSETEEIPLFHPLQSIEELVPPASPASLKVPFQRGVAKSPRAVLPPTQLATAPSAPYTLEGLAAFGDVTFAGPIRSRYLEIRHDGCRFGEGNKSVRGNGYPL